MSVAPQLLDNVDTAVETIIDRLGPDIRIGMPLGLGKPIQLINALYQRAKRRCRWRSPSRAVNWKAASCSPSSTACSTTARTWTT